MDSPVLGPAARCHHLAISVADLEACIAWYERVLDAEVTLEFALADFDLRVAFLSISGFEFELIERLGSSPKPVVGDPIAVAGTQGLGHVCFEVGDCDLVAAALRTRGVAFVREPEDVPELGLRLANFHDIEGNLFELREVLHESPAG